MARPSVYLRLGRVSNLPTVWTNVLCGMILSGVELQLVAFVVLTVALSLFYVAGMFLNDYYDRAIDARERPERPIPSGQIGAAEVAVIGYGMMAIALGLVSSAAHLGGAGNLWRPLTAGAALGGAIVLYNVWHKGNVLSPLLMGLCRMLVYVVAAFVASSHLATPVLEGMAVLLAYLIGLSYVAKQENLTEFKNLWPLAFLFAPFVYAALRLPSLRGAVGAAFFVGFFGWVLYSISLLLRKGKGLIPRAVVGLIAGIALLDALLLAGHDAPGQASLALLGHAATLFLQRFVRGT